MTETVPNVRIIPAKPHRVDTANPYKQLRVAAYCRVSTEMEEQQSSYQVQIEYYTEKINANKEWTLAGIFADEGISGTQTAKRTEFNRMIRICKQKRIDLILTKSISRFARNTVDCLEHIRLLKSLGIGVIFEKENFNTLTMTSEFLIALFSSFAQAESESISRNITLGVQMAFRSGKAQIHYVPTTSNFNCSIDKSTGLMTKYSYKGDLLISNGPRPNFWRGNVENDTGWGARGVFDGTWQSAADKIEVKSIEQKDGDNGKKIIISHLNLPNAKNTSVDITYTFSPDGTVKVDFNVDATRAGLGNFIRVGSLMMLPEGAEDVTWYGNGPVETFNDRKTNGRMGVWSDTVSHMFYPYMKADDTGNLTGLKWISVKNSNNKTSLLVAADGELEGSALHFLPSDLQKADHPFKLSPRNETVLSVDYGSMGTGSATCGQATLEKYRLPSNRPYSWSYTIIPVDSASTDKELTDIAAKLRSDGASIQDKSQNKLVVPVTAGAQLKTNSDGNAVSGAVSIPQCDAIDKALSGKNSFTVEANIVPTGTPQFNMIASKGDHAFGLRTENNKLYFFIHAGGEWRAVEYQTSDQSNWLGKKHQIAGIYDAENDMLRIYCDGKMVAEKSTGTSSGVTESSYNFTIGKCPETNRGSASDFYEVRVYSKALTESELVSQNTSSPAYGPDDKCVQLWLDFDNIAESVEPPEDEPLIGDANLDGKVTIADATAILQSLANKDKYSLCEEAARNADCFNVGDGVTGMDALAIQRLDAGVITSLPDSDK